MMSRAQFIAAEVEPDSAPRFRREFSLESDHGPVESATLSLSALGVCEAWINGTRVSNDLLTPGWTSYEWRLHSVDHDVTALLESRSAIGICVGNGWYRGRLGWIETQRYGEEIAAYAILAVRYADGHEQTITTDETWSVGPSDILSNDFYDGQVVDARRSGDDWCRVGFNDTEWGSVHAVAYPASRLVVDPVPPVRSVDELSPENIWTSPSGKLIIDFGKNIVGVVRLRAHGARGSRLVIRHAEVLEDGELATRTLRSAASVDEFILSGAEDVFEPRFTFHGFRYAEVTGWPEEIADLAVSAKAVVISSDLARTGSFECSVPDLNTLHDNIVRGMRGNFVDIPTDCPQRDERLGWTGDISAFSPTASFLFDVKDFLTDWLQDVGFEQMNRDGIVPFIVPDILKYATNAQNGASAEEPAAFWSDAAVWVPWSLWEAYGDESVLDASFDSMVAHGRRVQSLLSPSGVWDTGFQFGDWLDPDAPAAHPERAKADPGVVATACAYRTAARISATADILGDITIAEEFAAHRDALKAAFQREYVKGQRIQSDCTTVYSLAIVFGLLETDQKSWAGDRLAELVRESGHHISTGFAGTPFIADALTSTGHTDTAYRLLLQRECPSWLYPVTMGATTIWERWDSMLPDGSINPGDMTSFNHYALGAIADWMHREVAGLAPAEPGYRRLMVAPKIADGIDWARASLQTPYGYAAVSWQRDVGSITLDVDVPDGCTAIVVWPGLPPQDFSAGHHTTRLPLGQRR